MYREGKKPYFHDMKREHDKRETVTQRGEESRSLTDAVKTCAFIRWRVLVAETFRPSGASVKTEKNFQSGGRAATKKRCKHAN